MFSLHDMVAYRETFLQFILSHFLYFYFSISVILEFTIF